MIKLNEYQAEFLLELFGGDDESQICVGELAGHSGHGLYAWFEEYPEEGCTFLPEAAQPASGGGE